MILKRGDSGQNHVCVYFFSCGICIYPSRLVTSFGCLPYFEYKGRGQHFHCYAKRQVMVMLLSVKLFFCYTEKKSGAFSLTCCILLWA